MSGTTNRAESEHFEVRLVAVAENRKIETDGGLFDDDPETRRSTLFFLEVENASDERITWWYDEHDFLDGEGFQYKHGEFGGFLDDDAPAFLPAHWYPQIELVPGARARCVTGVDDPVEGASIERLVYDQGGDRYELVVNEDELDDPPIEL